MLNGEWNDKEFLVVEPGHTIKASHQDDILKSVPAPRDLEPRSQGDAWQRA